MNEEKVLTGYPSIDKPWLKYYDEEDISAEIPQCSIYENIYSNNSQNLQNTAILYYGKKITYGQMFINIEKAAKSFVALGVKAGDNVTLCMPAVPETIYTILALNRLGANANMLNPTFTQQQLIDRVNETEATVLVVLNELYPVMEKVILNTTIKIVISCSAVNSLGTIVKILKKAKNIPGTLAWNDFIKKGESITLPEYKYYPNMPAIMVYSSGTTGASKGIQLTNNSINATILNEGSIGIKWKKDDRFFAQVPIWFSTGVCISVLLPLAYGIVVILEPMYDFEIFYDHIKKYKPNFMITAVGLLEYLMSKQEIDPIYKEFSYLIAGGEYVAPYTEEKLNSWLSKNGAPNPLYKGYGMCECGGTVTTSNSQCNALGSAGIPLPQVTVSAFDLETGKELKYGQRGELRVLSPCRMLGYYKNPEATAKYFNEDENGNIWACTGDMGYVAEDGNVYVSGRISDSYINGNGDTIYLFDIERAALDVQSVRQCKAASHEIDGKLTHIIHTVIDDNSDINDTIENIKTRCKDILPDNHLPTLVKLYDNALPVAPSGKLDVTAMKNNISDLIEIKY